MATYSAKTDHSKDSSPVVGLLLVYYYPYAAASIERFISVMNSVSRSNVLIIIQNNRFELQKINHPNVHVITGDNDLREFSGWQAGLQYCKVHGLTSQDGIFILANDTFCHHNKFGPITQFAFARTFRKLLKEPTALTIAGEVHSNATEYTILNKPFSAWVSTYLFAMTFSLSNKMGNIFPHDVSMDDFFSKKIDPEKFLSGPISQNLKQHVQHWIFGLNGKTKWYGAAPISEENQHQFVGKAKSILCEKYLSANATSLGAKTLPVFSSPVLRQVRRLERLLPLMSHYLVQHRSSTGSNG